ncbi:MAG: sigma-70 family RNA polymerase sigma factor [Litorilinea sp.]
MTNDEAEWVEAARQGDQRAFGNLVRAYERPVYNLTYRMLGNPQEAEDAAQETFLRAYANLEKYNPSHKFSTWVFAIANNHCIDRLRKRRAVFVSIDDNPVLENLQSDAPLPEPAALRTEQSGEIQELISRLEPDYRTPLVLRYWEEYSYEEIAQTMQLTVAAVKSRLFRARQQLAQLVRTNEAAQISGVGAAAEARSGAQHGPGMAGSAARLRFATPARG